MTTKDHPPHLGRGLGSAHLDYNHGYYLTTNPAGVKMVDSSRHSTFPPLLGRYNSQINTEGVPMGARCSSGIKSLLDHHKTASNSQQVPKLDKAVQPRKSSLEILNRGIKLSAKRRVHEKAEGTFKAWNALIQKERDHKYRVLQQRVRIQRELIGKKDQVLQDLRTKAEEERLEKIQFVKKARREVASNIQAHYRRVEEHKKRVSKKLQEIEENRTDLSSPVAGAPQGKSIHMMPGLLDSDEVSPQSSEKAQAAVMQILGEHTKSIDTMWDGMKEKALKEISPFIEHSNQLKQVASPSVRQCLDIYNRPTARDRYGMPILLSDVLDETSATRGRQLTAMNSTLERLVRNTQTKAQLMLDNKHTLTSSTSCDPKFYITNEFSSTNQLQQKSESARVAKNTRSIITAPRRCNTSLDVKKQLPSYLTPDGDLVSGSLEELGDLIYCAPSRSRRTEQSTPVENSVFLTDIPRGSSQTSVSPLNSDLSKCGSQTSLRSVWQPLGSTALTEHRRVTERSVSGLGHLAHGRYSMWKPTTCVVNSSSEDNLRSLEFVDVSL